MTTETVSKAFIHIQYEEAMEQVKSTLSEDLKTYTAIVKNETPYPFVSMYKGTLLADDSITHYVTGFYEKPF